MSMFISTVVCTYLRWRYGGNFSALKPPLGYRCEYSNVSLRYKLRYRLWYYPRWRLENALFNRWGQPMRDQRQAEWERSKAISTERLLNDL